jgi:ABC-2 type transport system permease protein
VLLGTLAFAGLGLLLAGILRAETMLAVGNVLFVASLVLGGIVVPIDHLPAALAALAGALPAAALSDAMRVALGAAGDASGSVVLLAVWGLAAVVLAMRTFRWE